jgi:hypothetical protein
MKAMEIMLILEWWLETLNYVGIPFSLSKIYHGRAIRNKLFEIFKRFVDRDD